MTLTVSILMFKEKIMTRREMASLLAKRVGITVTKAHEILHVIFDAEGNEGLMVQEFLKKDGKVVIPGFGTFATRIRAGRKGTNPSNGKHITIPPRPYVYFRMGKHLRKKMEDSEHLS